MAFFDPILAVATAGSLNRDGFVQKRSGQLLSHTPQDVLHFQRQLLLLGNLSSLLKRCRIERVAAAIGGSQNNDRLLSRRDLIRGAGCLNREIGMSFRRYRVFGWNRATHEMLFDAFVLIDLYCSLGKADEYSALYGFRALLGKYIDLAVPLEENTEECSPLPADKDRRIRFSASTKPTDKAADPFAEEHTAGIPSSWQISTADPGSFEKGNRLQTDPEQLHASAPQAITGHRTCADTQAKPPVEMASVSCDESQESSESTMSLLFADRCDTDIAKYKISEDSGGGWHMIDIDLLAEPHYHRYTKITEETVVHNSHGTDSDTYYTEEVLGPDEAIALLGEEIPARSELKRFEEACLASYGSASKLISEYLPGCFPAGLIYNSAHSTVVRVREDGKKDSAVKICRLSQEDLQKLAAFRRSMLDRGWSKHIVEIESLLCIRQENSGSAALIKMPLLESAFKRDLHIYGNGNKRIGFRKMNDTGESIYACALDTAQALRDLHCLGFVHHDVRPENFLVDSDGRFYLGDIDSIRPLSDQYRSHFRSSHQYTAPELDRHAAFGSDIDCFAWGKSFLHILNGKPADGRISDTIRITADDQETCVTIDGSTRTFYGKEGRLAQIAGKAAQPDAKDRIRDGAALVDALTGRSDLL